MRLGRPATIRDCLCLCTLHGAEVVCDVASVQRWVLTYDGGPKLKAVRMCNPCADAWAKLPLVPR